MDEEVEARGGLVTEWYGRKMPMSCMVVMENLTDTSHFSFAHHGVSKGAQGSCCLGYQCTHDSFL